MKFTMVVGGIEPLVNGLIVGIISVTGLRSQLPLREIHKKTYL